MPKAKAIIFDLDGTLLDSREVILGAFKHVLNKHGRDYDENFVSKQIGRRLDKTYQTLMPDVDWEKSAKMHIEWQAANKHLLKGFSGLDEFLKSLDRSGLKLGLFTSSFKARAYLALDYLGIQRYFDAIICGDEVEKPKPDEEGLLMLAKSLGTSTDHMILVGDSEHDILSGKNAGVITIGISHGFGTKETLEESGADFIVSNLSELQSLLKEINAQ